MASTKTPQRRFHVGDWVSFPYGPRRAWAQVIEDRGPLGVKRRRLYRLRLDRTDGEPMTFELPEDNLEQAELKRPDVLSYLREGGLVAVLRTNLSGVPNPPPVWLTFSPQGRVTHTLNEEHGMVGGKPAPYSALHGDKVFTPKRNEVQDFLATFGLSETEASEIIEFIGTAP